MLAAYTACGEPTKLLELYLSAASRGAVKAASLPAEASWPSAVYQRQDWRASNFSMDDFLPEIDVSACIKPLGSRIIALWAAAVSGQNLLLSGKCSQQLALLTPMLAAFPARNAHGYDCVFPFLSAAACSAVASGATPASLSAGTAAQDTAAAADASSGTAELQGAAAVTKGRVLAVEDPQHAAALGSRRSWWDVAVDVDSGAVAVAKGGSPWGTGGGSTDFPSPLHKAVWDFVQAGLESAGDPPLQAFAKVWRDAGDRFIVAPLRKLTQAHGGALTRAALNQPSLAPAAQAFLWEAAHSLVADGVEGVALATEEGGEGGGSAAAEK